ncbi:hypothetical protein PDIDSM_5373 [Penicillium digitatum]|nr:hypothetical protein PDIDSM_5373 [Penicillium digitatum]
MYNRHKTRPISTAFFLIVATYFFFFWLPRIQTYQGRPTKPISRKDHTVRHDAIRLDKVTERFPVAEYIPLPKSSAKIPRIQHDFPEETRSERKARLKKRDAVKEAFLHSWNGYKDHAWMRDEVKPRTGGYQDTFNGWGATLVDSLDALVIMGLDDELQLALEALEEIDFKTTKSKHVPVFEIIIRYMGGFIAAHDLTEGKHPILLRKAVELGEMIFNAFDTHNRMPQVRWEWTRSAQGKEITPSSRTSLAEMGSLTMEFTRLTQLTGDPKYYDAVQRIMNELEIGQDKTRMPGIPEHILLGAQTDKYRRMYEKAIITFNENLLFRGMTQDEDQHILFTANVVAMRGDTKTFQYTPDHLKCFMGGTVAIGAKVFNRPEDMYVARGLTDGCVWAYDVMPRGIMPEVFKVTPCEHIDECPWDEEQWIPEALESLFVMYRITGDKTLQDSAWRMFKNIDKATRTKFGHSSINDVRHVKPKHEDKMESFWLAETLKYLYLIFSEPDHISLDHYVLYEHRSPSVQAAKLKRPNIEISCTGSIISKFLIYINKTGVTGSKAFIL